MIGNRKCCGKGKIMEASKVTIGDKTYDMNHLRGGKKTNLRRKLIIEFIQSKPSGTTISIPEFQRVGHFSTNANTHTFVSRMIRDGVIQRHDGDRPKTYFYSVTGSVRISTPKKVLEQLPAPDKASPDINGFITDMQKLGVKFTITISNETV